MQEFLHPDVVNFIRRAARQDPVLLKVKAAVDQAGLPSISPEAGRTLEVLVRSLRAKRVLEVGTCYGYSTIWMARGLPPGGRIDTIDFDPARAAVAEKHFKLAKLGRKVQLRLEDAHKLLPKLKKGSYDLVFLDADKEWMPKYLQEAVRLTRSGGLVCADNVFWQGSAFDDSVRIGGREEIRAFVDAALSHPKLVPAILPLGDGLLVAHRK